MELKRVVSVYEMNRNNFLLYIFYLLTKITFGYFTIKQVKGICKCITNKMKKIRQTGLFYIFFDFIFVLMNLIEIIIMLYVVHLVSFYDLRQNIFEYVNFNFSTNSNLRDLESFKIFYCKNYPDSDNAAAEIKSDATNFMTVISNMCYLNKVFDDFYFEYFLLFFIVIHSLYRNYSYYTSRENEQNHMKIGIFYKILYISMALVQIIYYAIIYYRFLKLKSDLALQRKMSSFNSDYPNEIYSDSYKIDDYIDINVEGKYSTEETINRNDSVNGEHLSFWNIIGPIFEFLIEVLAD